MTPDAQIRTPLIEWLRGQPRSETQEQLKALVAVSQRLGFVEEGGDFDAAHEQVVAERRKPIQPAPKQSLLF